MLGISEKLQKEVMADVANNLSWTEIAARYKLGSMAVLRLQHHSKRKQLIQAFRDSKNPGQSMTAKDAADLFGVSESRTREILQARAGAPERKKSFRGTPLFLWPVAKILEIADTYEPRFQQSRIKRSGRKPGPKRSTDRNRPDESAKVTMAQQALALTAQDSSASLPSRVQSFVRRLQSDIDCHEIHRIVIDMRDQKIRITYLREEESSFGQQE